MAGLTVCTAGVRMSEDKRVVQVKNAVFVADGVDPGAAAYAAGLQARRMGRRPTKADIPVGTVALPPVPHLNQESIDGHTMAEQAVLQQQVTAGLAFQRAQAGIGQASESIVEPPQQVGLGTQPPRLQLRPDDVLPPEAKQDPSYREGHGSMLAMNRPDLAAKYGVVRGGQKMRVNAPTPVGQPKGLSPETIAGLQALKRQSEGEGARVGLPKTEEEAEALVPEAIRREPPAEEVAVTLTADQQTRLKEFLDSRDAFEQDSLRRSVSKDELNNDQQRKIIESALEPLDVTDLILHNRIKQKVPILPGKLEATFQSMTGEEELALKRLIMRETKDLEVSERYFFDKFALMGLAVGLFAVGSKAGGTPLATHLDADGNFDEKKFEEKMARVLKFNTHMLANLANNHHWFELRVRRLLVVEKVGNG